MARFLSFTNKTAVAAVIASLSFAQAAVAGPLNLNFTATSDDGIAVDYGTVNAAPNTPAATSISTYSHIFPSAPYYTIPGTSFEFYDDYVFTIGESTVSSITATIDLGNTFDISELNVRLFSWDGKDEQLFGRVTLGSVGSGNIIQAWTYATGTGEVAVINQSGLNSGTYVLQVRGNLSGTNGGGYVGSLNVIPVPLPAALPMFLSGMCLLGGLFRRR